MFDTGRNNLKPTRIMACSICIDVMNIDKLMSADFWACFNAEKTPLQHFIFLIFFVQLRDSSDYCFKMRR